MGGVLSDDGFSPQVQQQQRAQLLLLSQLREGGLAIRPTEQPVFRQTQVYKNPLHIKGKTIHLTHKGKEGVFDDNFLKLELVFTFDADVPCEVLVHMGMKDDHGDLPPHGATWTSEAWSYQASLGQECCCEVDLSELMPALNQADAWASIPPMAFCLEIRTQSSSGDVTGPTEWTLGRFLNFSCLRPEVEVRAQQVHLPGAGQETYEMHEVFGAESHDPAVLGQDCVICMSETRDTAVLPCRHMCLCGGCAQTMRSRVQYRSYRCPICRERVSSLLQAKKTGHDKKEAMDPLAMPVPVVEP